MAVRYLVGIDLGTTNSAVAFVDLRTQSAAGPVKLQSFPIAQLVAAGEVNEKPLLPSFLYLPGPHDLPAGATALPWDATPPDVVGTFARNQGARIPGRLVSSAKSWLCHAGVDRTAELLPWGAPPEVPRRSPMEVSARYLRHIIDAWNHAPKRQPADRLEDQSVVLTVPASFDDVARELTMQAAKEAGLKHVTLLEEPQAAFYCWMGMNDANEIGRMKPGMRCCVVDVGGGTSDFSLIRAAEDEGELTFIREAVGDHLLLGGDNMDLALARFAESKFGIRLDAAQFGQLVQACRAAKEQLLSPEPPPEVPITVVGRGRSLVGGTLTTTLTPEDAQRIIVEGFFPRVQADATPERAGRGGLQEMGLPYVSDPAVTRHLAAFLRQHIPEGEKLDTILFNGGVFQPDLLREYLVEVLRPWYEKPDTIWEPLVLSNPSLDLAVSWGAAYSGWLRHIGGKRIGGGIPRSYYVAIEADRAEPNHESVLCVVPRRLEEGEIVTLPEPELELAIGEPVLFPLFTSTVRGDDKPGEILSLSPSQLMTLPSLHTILRGGKKSKARRTPVTLEARCTEIGTLELYCLARDGDNRWKLEFNVRDVVKGPAAKRSDEDVDTDAGMVVDVFPEELVEAVAREINGCFVEQEPAPSPKELNKALETALESSRDAWPTGLCRRLWDIVASVAEQRLRSPQHQGRWYNLAGWSLRPGFGDPLDRFRVEQLWKLLNAPAKDKGKGVIEGGADYWVMWRRVAGGLSPALQQNLFNRLRNYLLPGKGKGVPKPNPNELAEMWRVAASMERLDAKTKETLGAVLLKQVGRPPVANYVFWSLTRLGARVPFYGPLNTVLHPKIVEGWIDELAGFEPTHDSERKQWAFCLAQLARMTGQRALDIDDSQRKTVRVILREMEGPESWEQMIEEVMDVQGDDQRQLFGESLPIGLRLATR